VDNASYLASLSAAIDRFVALIERADLDATVPSCPDWDVAALVEHVTVVHTWVGGILASGSDAARLDAIVVDRPARQASAYAAWYRDAAHTMHRDLGTRDPDAPCWNFAGVNQTFGFWPRRQMNEVNVHAFDAALAAGSEFAIEPEQAADGIDELLAVFGPRMAMRGFSPVLDAPVTIAPTDADATWTVLPPGERGHAEVVDDDRGSVARLVGSASDLFLALWNRLPLERLTIEGDAAAVSAYIGSRRAP
jgi:uncharacterized protein (TIGR03083 family)